jgi:hypothetical protein
LEAYPQVEGRSLDELAWKHIRQYVAETGTMPSRFLNNYVVFTVMTIIRRERVTFAIEQRRWQACPDCLVQLRQKLIMDMGVRTNWFHISKFKIQIQNAASQINKIFIDEDKKT